RWSRAHRARFLHALTGLVSAPAGRWQPAPIAVDGDNSTPAVARSQLPWNPLVNHGPAFRLLADLAGADSALGVVPPANAYPSPAADDMLAAWANHEYVPLYLSWERVERAARATMTLAPGR